MQSNPSWDLQLLDLLLGPVNLHPFYSPVDFASSVVPLQSGQVLRPSHRPPIDLVDGREENAVLLELIASQLRHRTVPHCLSIAFPLLLFLLNLVLDHGFDKLPLCISNRVAHILDKNRIIPQAFLGHELLIQQELLLEWAICPGLIVE